MQEIRGAILRDRGLVEISGEVAREFLQGLVTVNVDDVRDGTGRHGALLTPQGKILFEFAILAAGDDRFLLDTAKPLAADLAKRLTFYRLRAKVDILVRDDLVVVAVWGSETPPLEGAVPDPRLADLGWRAVPAEAEAEASMRAAGIEVVPETAYRARRIGLGVPELGSDYATGEIFPHEADLDQLSGVDFDKGCFVGQEVVSRMQHRGTARKRFVPVSVSGTAPEAGAEITVDGKPLGTMGGHADGTALALIRLDRLGEAAAGGKPVEADGAVLTPHRPAWARFDWPEGLAS